MLYPYFYPLPYLPNPHFDGQGHASIIYGVKNTNKLEVTSNTLIRKVIEDEPLPEPDSYMLKTKCGVDVIPSNRQLFTLERNLCNVDFRERMLSRYVDTIKDSYQYIIIDCMPQMGTPMINVMMCANSIIVSIQAELLYAGIDGTIEALSDHSQEQQSPPAD